MVGVLYNPAQPLGLVEMALPMPKPTLGQRNNNYGNLRTTDAFLGKTGTNKTYDTYETPEMGLRALARVLDTYGTKHGINTIDQLVNRYAPESDNPGGSHENYKKFLAANLGIGINDPLDVKGRRVDLMDAIIRFENKNRSLATRDQLQNAIYAADGTGDNNMAPGDKLSLEDDYRMGVQNGGVFVYPENYERYKKEQAAAASGALAGTFMDESYSPPPVLEGPIQGDASGVLANIQSQINRMVEGKNDQSVMAMPSEDDATVNIDGTPVNDSAILYTLPQAVGGALSTGANAQPQGPVFNGPYQAGTTPGPKVGNAQATNMPVTNNQPPAVVSQLPAAPRMTAPTVSGNRRNLSQVALPSATIDTNEMLMRVGLAGVGGSQQGGLQALSDMGAMYGSIQDANRATGLEAYKATMDAAAKGKSEPDADTQAQLSQMDSALFDMKRAKEFLKEGGITGLFDNNIKGFFDNLSGNKRAVGRKLLERLRVDDTLLRIAQTKGAISNKEMDLFLSPSPDLNDQETVWEQWIDDRMQAIMRVRSRLAGGQTVDAAERASAGQVDQFASQAPTTSNTQVSPNVAAARAALNQ